MAPPPVIFLTAEEDQRDRQKRHRRDHGGTEEALVEGGHDVVGSAELDHVGARDRGEQADAADDQRVEHQGALRGFGEEDGAEQHGGDHGDRVGLEEVGGHAGAVTDIVADIVGDHGGIARVIFGNAGFDLADEVSADIGALGEDAAAEAGEDRDERGTEGEANQGFENAAGLHADHQEKTVVDGDAEQAEGHDEHARDSAGLEGDAERGREAFGGRFGGAHIGLHRDGHADIAGDAREHRADQIAEADMEAEEDPEQQKHDRADHGDGHVLAVQIGHGAFLDGAGDLAHAVIAGGLGEDRASGHHAVGEADAAARQYQ